LCEKLSDKVSQTKLQKKGVIKLSDTGAGIDVEKSKKEFDVVMRFIYVLNHSDESHMSWMDFCNKERNGRQDMEELSKLVSSIASPRPWRFIVGEKDMEWIQQRLAGDTSKKGDAVCPM